MGVRSRQGPLIARATSSPRRPHIGRAAPPAACPDVCAARAALRADFNNDGFADLAVGAPLESIGSLFAVGAVNVLYGTPTGLTGSGSQTFTQNSPGVGSTAEEFDSFGFALAASGARGQTAVQSPLHHRPRHCPTCYGQSPPLAESPTHVCAPSRAREGAQTHGRPRGGGCRRCEPRRGRVRRTVPEPPARHLARLRPLLLAGATQPMQSRLLGVCAWRHERAIKSRLIGDQSIRL
jgi:FG-GAP repeat